jgi:hypothetical protein
LSRSASFEVCLSKLAFPFFPNGMSCLDNAALIFLSDCLMHVWIFAMDHSRSVLIAFPTNSPLRASDAMTWLSNIFDLFRGLFFNQHNISTSVTESEFSFMVFFIRYFHFSPRVFLGASSYGPPLAIFVYVLHPFGEPGTFLLYCLFRKTCLVVAPELWRQISCS